VDVSADAIQPATLAAHVGRQSRRGWIGGSLWLAAGCGLAMGLKYRRDLASAIKLLQSKLPA